MWRGLFACAVLACSAPAVAQERLVVVSVAIGEGDASTDAAATALAAAADDRGVRTLTGEPAGARFRQMGSAPPPSVSATDVDRWLATSREAVRELARANYDAARTRLREAQELSDRAAEELNREAENARNLLDTCLFMVRAFIETRDFARAESQARDCRRASPRGEASPGIHPPEVVRVFERVDAEIARASPATLRVASTEPGCTVRLNGIEIGTTPHTIGELVPGDYRVQVECESNERGRVHRVSLGEGLTELRIDTKFDRAVRTEPGLQLAYDSPAEALALGREHAGTVARQLGAEGAWLVLPESSGAVRVDHVSPAGALVTSVRVVRGTPGSVERAVDSLLSGQSTDLAAGPSAVDFEDPDRPQDDTGGFGASEWIGVGLVAAGAAAYLGAWLSFDARITRGDQYLIAQPEDPDFLSRQQTWRDARDPIFPLALLGAGLMIGGEMLLLSSDDGVPVWAWVAGGVGLAVVTTGLAIAIGADPCSGDVAPDRACVDEWHAADRGLLVALQGLPLLSVPFAYLIDSALGDSSASESLAIAPMPGGALVSLRGDL